MIDEILRLENDDASTFVDVVNDICRLQNRYSFAGGDDDRVTEVFELLVRESTPAAARARVDDLEELLEQAFDWHKDELRHDSVWLRWVTDEENEKRALVYAYELRMLEKGAYSPRRLDGGGGFFQLVITRHISYEEVEAQTVTASGVSLGAGTWDLTATLLGGRVDGRIKSLRITPAGTATYDRAWIGFRRPREGVADFDPVLECEDGTAVATGVASAADATASSGFAMRTDFTLGPGAAMAYRFQYALSDTGATNLDHYVGRYMLLHRYRLSASGSVVGLRASLSYTSPAYDVPQTLLQEQYVTANVYHIQAMGEIRIPPLGWRSPFTSYALNNLRINVEAERLSGSAQYYYADAFYLVPLDCFISWLGGTVDTALASPASFNFYTLPNDVVDAVAIELVGGGVYRIADHGTPNPHDFAYPHEGGIGVVVAQQAGGVGHIYTDNAELTIEVARRWRTYRD